MTALDLMLSVILILLGLYIVVWIRGPREGKMARENRLLRHARNYWRKRAQKKQLVLVALLVLFLLPIANPSMSSIPAARGDEPQTAKDFELSADGDESSESITSFSETTADDVMYYPDGYNTTPALHDWRNTMDSATWGVGGSCSKTETAEILILEMTVAGGIGSREYCYTNDPSYSTVGDDFHIEFEYRVNNTNVDFYEAWLRDGDSFGGGSNGYLVLNPAAANVWYAAHLNVTTPANGVESIVFSAADSVSEEAKFEIRHLVVTECWGSYSGYHEDFADVSDITVSVGETVTTDGDLGTFHHPGDNAWDYYFFNAPSALAVQIIEWRCHANISSSSYEFALYSADDGGGSQLWTSGSITAPTSAATKKHSPMVTGVESIRLATNASSQASLVFDYLRGSLSTEAGWCHSGSTTAGVTNDGDADVTYTTSSDGDILTMNATKAPGAAGGYVEFHIAIDTTATSADIEDDYYPFFGIRVHVASDLSNVKVIPIWDGRYFAETIVRDSWQTLRFNHKTAIGSSGSKLLRFDAYLVESQSVEWKMDWAKACSIANFTVTQSGVGTDDYLYVDSGVLHSNTDSGYIELNHDPALSVSDTYPVYNLTTSTTAPEFSQYVSSWSTYSDDTRGATTTGTVTDIKLKFDSTEVLSAIKFIEDSTAPAVVRSSSTPNDPEDDEAVTLSAVITDTVEVYSVKFNAIVYPTGFSDVDYSATEQADNLWTYEFSSLITGYYCFKIIASDGANTNALTEYAYLELSVREAAIMVEEITLIGAGSDFDMMTFSARINRDCSYTIYEESASSAESDTHTGSVTAPSFNLAWTKLDVTDANVNFTIKFTSGSLSYNYTSQYQVAQNTFYIEFYNHDGPNAASTVTVTGRITKLGSYTVYIDDVSATTGTVSELDFEIEFTKTGAEGVWHEWGIKFTNGSQTCWANGTYYRWEYSPDRAERGGAAVAEARSALQVASWTLIGVAAIIIYILTQGRKEGNL